MTLTLIEIEREHPVGSLRQPDGVFPFKEKNMAQIIINRSESRCGNCGKSAFMEEGGHYTIAGYKDNGLPGCGEEWDSVSSDYPNIPAMLVAGSEGYWFAENLRGLPVYDAAHTEPIGVYGGPSRKNAEVSALRRQADISVSQDNDVR
jgi:hypothetical protein